VRAWALFGLRHGRSVGLPTAYLPDADLEGVGESLLAGVTAGETGRLEAGVARGACH
jgi:hypothetical protein